MSPFFLFQLIHQLHFISVCSLHESPQLVQLGFHLQCVLQKCAIKESWRLWLSHNDDRTATDLFLALSEQRQLLLHLSGMTCGSCHFRPLQVLLGQELLDVLLLLLQGLLQGRGAWDLPCVPSRRLCELADYWQVLFQIIFKEKRQR